MLNGKELEEAVAPVVAAILAGDQLGMRDFKIEPNKTIRPLGVPHEIDLYVTEQTPAGEKIYLFECKNTKRPVGKEAVVSLKAKMNLVCAARGFVVGLRFTKHARAQAKIDGIELLDATKHQISPVGLQAFSGFAQTVTIRNMTTECGPVSVALDTAVRFEGAEMPFAKAAERFAKELVAHRIIQPDTRALSPGVHEIAGAATITLEPGELTVGEHSIRSFEIICPITFTTQNPAIRYGYDVGAQHVVAKYEKFQISENQWADTITVSAQ